MNFTPIDMKGSVEGFCLIKTLDIKTSSKGDTYLDIMLSDKEGEINAKLWSYNPAFHGEFAVGQIVKVRGVDFGTTSPTSVTAMLKVAGGGEGAIQIRVDSLDGEIVGYVNVDRLTGVEYEAYTSELDTKITGVHDLYFIFCGDGYRVMSWQFGK